MMGYSSPPNDSEPRRILREAAILYALWVLPSLIVVDAPALVSIDSVTALIRTIVHHTAFGLLIIYILDLQDLRRRVFSPTDGTAIGSLRPILQFLFVAAALFVLSLVVAGVFRTDSADRSQFRLTLGDGFWWWSTAVVAMVAVGILEELFFRYYLLYRLVQLGGSHGAAILTAAGLFALGHSYQGVPAIVFSALAGVLLGLFRLRFGVRFLPLAAGHAVYNIGALLISTM